MASEISRREFLSTVGSVAAAAAGGALLSDCGAPEAEVIEKTVEVQVEVEKTVEVEVEKVVEVEKAVTATPAPTVELSLWKGASSFWDVFFDGIAARMAYAGVTPKVNIELPILPWGEFWDKVQLAGEAGVGPDLLYFNYNTMERLIDAEAIRPVPESVYPYEQIPQDFLAHIVEPLTLYDGKYYYVPWEIHLVSLNRNLTILEEAGYTEPPTSWDEFLEQAQACVKRENGELVQSGFSTDNAMMMFKDILETIGGRYIRPGDTEVPFDNELGWEAMEILADWNRKYDIHHPEFNIALGGWWAAGYLWGKVGFNWWFPGANDMMEAQSVGMAGGGVPDVSVFMPKIGPNGYQEGTRPNWGLGVTGACAEEKLDAAWTVFKFCLSKEESMEYCRLSKFVSARQDVLAMGKDAYDPGPRQEEMQYTVDALLCCSFVWGQPKLEPEWIETLTDIYWDVVEGESAKDAFAANMDRLQNALTG